MPTEAPGNRGNAISHPVVSWDGWKFLGLLWQKTAEKLSGNCLDVRGVGWQYLSGLASCTSELNSLECEGKFQSLLWRDGLV